MDEAARQSVAAGYETVLAEDAASFAAAEILFREYAASLDFDLCFQGFDKELQEINIQYSNPSGGLILIRHAHEYVGCAGVRKFDGNIAELKRMYVKPEHRGKGLGNSLLSAALDIAQKLNYEWIRLDTVETMKDAIRLYTSAGFYPIEPYRHNPIKSVLYFEKKL